MLKPLHKMCPSVPMLREVPRHVCGKYRNLPVHVCVYNYAQYVQYYCSSSSIVVVVVIVVIVVIVIIATMEMIALF